MEDLDRLFEESVDSYPVITAHLHAAEKAEAMTALPSIELLSPGSRPSEPGWYVLQDRLGNRQVAEAAIGRRDLLIWLAGADEPTDVYGCEKCFVRFIARIYPERIGQE